MKILFYSSKNFELPYIKLANTAGFEQIFVSEALSEETAEMSNGYDVVSIFAGDDAGTEVIKKLKVAGVKLIAVRATGYDNVDITKANESGIHVVNVPEYSPYAIAEHTVAMVLAMNRKLVMADEQVSNHNFTIDNLVGFDLNKKKVGIVGTGKIGAVMAKIFHGFGCTILAFDKDKNSALKAPTMSYTQA